MKKYMIIADILIGLAVSALAVLLSAIAFGDIWFAALAAVPVLIVSVLLLRSKRKTGRTVRSIAAAAGYVPCIFLLGREPVAVFSRMFAFINPEYVREYGGPWAGDGFGLITVDLPGAFLLLLLAILIAKQSSGKRRISLWFGRSPL